MPTTSHRHNVVHSFDHEEEEDEEPYTDPRRMYLTLAIMTLCVVTWIVVDDLRNRSANSGTDPTTSTAVVPKTIPSLPPPPRDSVLENAAKDGDGTATVRSTAHPDATPTPPLLPPPVGGEAVGGSEEGTPQQSSNGVASGV